MSLAEANVSFGDHWYVTNGVVAVGPVDFNLLTRGVAQGRIPTASFVRHESWKVWRRLQDIESLSAHARQQTVERLASLSASAEEKASNPKNEAPPLPSGDAFDDELEGPRSSIRPVSVDPVGVLARAADLDDALLFALSTSVAAASAEVGFIERVRPDLGVTFTACAHGPGAEALLGEKLSADDPSLGAAHAGLTLIVEPRPGEAGRYVMARVRRCLPQARGAAMVPLVHRGSLVGMLELGRQGRPFRAREIARVEDVVDALAERIVVAGWLE